MLRVVSVVTLVGCTQRIISKGQRELIYFLVIWSAFTLKIISIVNEKLNISKQSQSNMMNLTVLFYHISHSIVTNALI